MPDIFAAMPKVELHLHIDCSLSHRVVNALGADLDEQAFLARFTAPAQCTSLKQYLDAIAPSAALLQSPESLRIATRELIADLAVDGLIYAELRFAPQRHVDNGHDLDELIDGVLLGVSDARMSSDCQVGIILCALRDDPTEVGLNVVEAAHRFRGRGVVGLDLAGNEAGHDIAPQIPVFERACALNIDVTAHAGEACGAQSVHETLTELGVRRIGHGVRSIEDEAAIVRLKDLDVHLEVCPSSNIQVGVFPSYAQHPVHKLAELGVALSINTDARTVAHLTLTEEYRRLHAHFGWGADDFLACNLQAIDAAFLSETARASLRHRYLDAWRAAGLNG